MHYPIIAIPDSEIPAAADPVFQHLLTTYASETNKTASMWRAVPDDCLDFRPHEKTNSIRTIFVHQLLSERRFFAEFVATDEPPVDEILPTAENPSTADYIDRYITFARCRLPQFAVATREWWLEPRPFFEGLTRERIWIFWRRLLHTCHHRTQVQSWLRLAGRYVPAIYGPSGDESRSDADPTYSLAAASRPAPRDEDET